jgi:hypothetical protein
MHERRKICNTEYKTCEASRVALFKAAALLVGDTFEKTK